MDPTGGWQQWVERTIESNRAMHLTTPKPDAHSDVVVPTMQAAAIGAVIAAALMGLLYLVGASWPAAWRWGAGLGLATFAACEVWFLLQHRWVYGAGIRLSYERLWATQARPERREPRRAILVINPRRPAGRPMVDARPALGVLEHAVPALQEPDAEVVELYRFIVTLWRTGDISRDAARRSGFGRAAWERYIGGQRAGRGRESARGLLDRAGMCRRTSGGWMIIAPMGAALAWNDELRAYAHAQRDGGMGPGRDTHGGALQVFKRLGGGQ